MSDIGMSVARVLRPYQGFEYYYGEATPGNHPVRLQPVNPRLILPRSDPPADPYAWDPNARNGVEGYSQNLSAMLPMSAVGSMALVYIPQIPFVTEEQGTSPFMYSFVPVWRMRTVADWVRSRTPGNMPLQRFGAADTVGETSENRYLLPAARGAAIYMRPEPTTETMAAASLVHQVAYAEGIGMVTSPYGASWRPPIGPFYRQMSTQQGVVDAAANNVGSQPFYRPFWIKICGNELAFDVYKVEVASQPTSQVTYRAWDFRYNIETGYCSVGEDIGFSMVFGVGASPSDRPGLSGDHLWSGVYVFTGLA